MSIIERVQSVAYQLGAHDYNEGKANDVLRVQHLRDRIALALHAITLPEAVTEIEIGNAYSEGRAKAEAIGAGHRIK